LKLLADFRIRLENQEQLLHNEEIVGERIQARVIKNRFFPLLNATYFDIIFKQGINKSAEIFALGIHTRLIRNLSEGYFYQTVHLGKTASQALHFLEENRQIREDAEKNIGQAFMPLNLNAAT
jgi:recombination protein RecA